MDTDYHDQGQIRGNSGGRQFEARWLQEETVSTIVTSAWNKAKLAGQGPTLADRTKAVLVDMHDWDRDVLKAPKKRINKLKKEVEKLKRGSNSLDSRARQKEIQALIENLLDQEEIHWLQRG